MDLDTTKLEELGQDIEDRFENITAIKGTAFCNAVKMAINMNNILHASIIDELPRDIKAKVMVTLCGECTREVFSILGIDDVEQRKEVVEMAKSIDESVRQHARAAVKKSDGEG